MPSVTCPSVESCAIGYGADRNCMLRKDPLLMPGQAAMFAYIILTSGLLDLMNEMK